MQHPADPKTLLVLLSALYHYQRNTNHMPQISRDVCKNMWTEISEKLQNKHNYYNLYFHAELIDLFPLKKLIMVHIKMIYYPVEYRYLHCKWQPIGDLKSIYFLPLAHNVTKICNISLYVLTNL